MIVCLIGERSFEALCSVIRFLLLECAQIFSRLKIKKRQELQEPSLFTRGWKSLKVAQKSKRRAPLQAYGSNHRFLVR